MKEIRIELPFALGVSRAQDVRQELMAALEQDATIVLDAEDVDSVDTIGLQLMLSFIATARVRERVWRWNNVSDAIRRIADLCGVTEPLQLPDVQP